MKFLSSLVIIFCLVQASAYESPEFLNNFGIFRFNQPLNTVQFVVVGDTGKDNDGQRAVADAMKRHCAVESCQYGMLVGDNIYEAGMTSVDDPVLDRVFKKYYETLGFPFFITLGNHDYGKLSNSWERGAYQLEYSKKNPQYYLPHYYYYQVFDHFILVVLDTTRLMWSRDIEAQEMMINEAYAKAKGRWVIVAAHHPFLSNGDHGNAGDYDRVSWPPFISGRDVKKFVEKNVCGKAQLYISGHDHNLQLTDGKIKGCPTLFAVSGAGASTENLSNRNPSLFEADKIGFLSLSVSPEKISLRFFGDQNQLLFSQQLKH